jgi:hypothetical protein
MKLTTTIGWNSPWLRRMILWCCRELDYPATRITAAHFTLAHRCSYAGRAYLGRHAIRVKINPLNGYPLPCTAPRSLPPTEQVDAVEVLVLVTAHEIAHLERWDRFAREKRCRGERDSTKERDTEWMARRVLGAFRGSRTGLLERWGDSGPGPVKPRVVHQLTCRRCGTVWRYARLSGNYKRLSCGRCFKTWGKAAAAGEFLAYEKVGMTE